MINALLSASYDVHDTQFIVIFINFVYKSQIVNRKFNAKILYLLNRNDHRLAFFFFFGNFIHLTNMKIINLTKLLKIS